MFSSYYSNIKPVPMWVYNAFSEMGFWYMSWFIKKVSVREVKLIVNWDLRFWFAAIAKDFCGFFWKGIWRCWGGEVLSNLLGFVVICCSYKEGCLVFFEVGHSFLYFFF